MTLKGDVNCKRKLTCGLKNDVRYLINFHASSRKSENLHFDGFLLSKAYQVLDEKVQKSYLMTLKIDARFEEKLTLGSKNDMRNLVNFNAISSKSENLNFDELLLSITYKASAKNIQKSYLSWHWRVIQTLKKKWIFVSKECLKICTLMGYFCL